VPVRFRPRVQSRTSYSCSAFFMLKLSLISVQTKLHYHENQNIINAIQYWFDV